jgi:hypothetical protein
MLTTAKILDGTIQPDTLIYATDAVTTKIADANVTTAKIADANVTTAKIADAAVTNAKLDKADIPLSGFAAAADLGTSFKLINVLDPTLAQDAATKTM